MAVLLLNFLIASPVHAEEDEATSSPTTVREVKLDSIQKYKEAREEAIKEREEAMEELRARKQEAAEEREQKREEFRAKLIEIQNERKQKILENIDERIVKVNEKWVEHWSNVLDRLTSIVAKIDERSGGEVDTSAAKTAIANAESAINTQAGMVYEITIEDEETLGENVSEVLEKFHSDLREVHTTIKTAKEEVVKALRSLKSTNGDDDESEEGNEE